MSEEKNYQENNQENNQENKARDPKGNDSKSNDPKAMMLAALAKKQKGGMHRRKAGSA